MSDQVVRVIVIQKTLIEHIEKLRQVKAVLEEEEAASMDLSLNTKNVFSSALRFAMSIDTLKNSPELAHELKTSAQEQVEFMLSEDEEWLCKVLPRMELMKDLVFKWADVSSEILVIAQNCKLGVKVKLVEVTGKVLEAVGYGVVIVPCGSRACLLKLWLPFIRRLKTLVDAEGSGSEYRMDEDLCEFLEGSMVSLVLTLPSNDQAEVFGEWMRGIALEGVKFPDLSEAFESLAPDADVYGETPRHIPPTDALQRKKEG
ncbi:hypothetical protein HID58_033949 [Brassica napus]|uniref:At3g05675-like ankyrin-like domain-containing protein n=1 Tax=Brassica napus TaxID=3708 RepID=A0ABQ8C1X8_BRANA|nr:hypothetical protein HID58_033949 [Brassica napus]